MEGAVCVFQAWKKGGEGRAAGLVLEGRLLKGVG